MFKSMKLMVNKMDKMGERDKVPLAVSL